MLLLIVAGFACGILALGLSPFSWPLLYLGIVLASASFALFGFQKHKTHLYAGVFFLFLALGVARALFVPTALSPAFTSLIDSEVTFTGTVVVPPDVRETSQRITVEFHGGAEVTRVLAVAPLYPVVTYGSLVEVSGTLMRPEPFATDGGRVFRYDQFLAKDGVYLIIPKTQIHELEPRSGWWFTVSGFFVDIKDGGIDALSRALPEPHASLAAGLILGGKQGLGEDLLNDFIHAGLVHIVVLSGYNVMIIADFVMRLFGFLSVQSGAFAGIGAIILFVFSAGAGPASIRAGIMAAIALYARATGKTYVAFNALLVAALLMLIVNPLTLLHDPGFQLSFVATLGLIFGAPITERWFAFITSGFVREIVASTIAAQIAVLPLLLYQNGLFSLVAVPANLVVLPIVPIAMLASFVALLTGMVLPTIAPIAALPAFGLLAYIITTVQLASAVPFGAFTLSAFPFFLVVIAYVVLGIFVARAMKHV